MLAAVLLDVDFTLFRPGPRLGPTGYERIGARHGLTLDGARYDEARLAALRDLQRHPELVHDEELWIRFTEDIVTGMGGDPVLSRSCAVELVREWGRHENFFLYDDALPALAALRDRDLRIGLVSNGQRDLDEFVRHHGLDVDVRRVPRARKGQAAPVDLRGGAHGARRPARRRSHGRGQLRRRHRGARALGMHAILVDRDGLHVDEPDRIDTLLALPAALGLTS